MSGSRNGRIPGDATRRAHMALKILRAHRLRLRNGFSVAPVSVRVEPLSDGRDIAYVDYATGGEAKYDLLAPFRDGSWHREHPDRQRKR